MGEDIGKAGSEPARSAPEPVKTPLKVASKRIPEAHVSLLSRAIRQGLEDYGWKNFGTIPEVLAGYIIQAETAEAEKHPKQSAPSVAVKVKPLEWKEGNPGSYTEIAESPFGHYSVWEINGTGCWAPWKQGSGSIVDGGLAGAKAAAQADYEARIRSAVSAQVQDVAVRKLEIAENAMRSTIMSGSIWKLEEALEEMEIIDLSDAAPAKQGG